MSNFVSRIYDFNRDNGLLEQGYNDYLESSFQIEEALEGFEVPGSDLTLSFNNPKTTSRAIVAWMQRDSEPDFTISDVERLDKACDSVVYAVGSMAKLGLNVEQIHQAINIVMDANRAKTGCPKDEHGKLMKPANFPEPQPRLQELLDARIN